MKKFVITAAVAAITALSALSVFGPAEAASVKAVTDTTVKIGDTDFSHKDGIAVDMSASEMVAVGAMFGM